MQFQIIVTVAKVFARLPKSGARACRPRNGGRDIRTRMMLLIEIMPYGGWKRVLRLIGCVLVLAWGLSVPEGVGAPNEGDSTIAVPSAAELLAGLQTEHPRLLVGREAFDRVLMLVEESAEVREIYEMLRERGEKLLETPPPVHRDSRTILTLFARPLMHRVYTLALLARVENDRRFVDRAWAELEAGAVFPNWRSGNHFLDTAEMAHGFAIGYDWLYDYWDDEQREVLRDAIVRLALRPGLCAYGIGEDCDRVDRRWVDGGLTGTWSATAGLASPHWLLPRASRRSPARSLRARCGARRSG